MPLATARIVTVRFLTAIVLFTLVRVHVARSDVLVVPACDDTLQVVVRLPKALQHAPGRSCTLVEIGAQDVRIPTQVVSAIDGDGTPKAESGCLITSIPPRSAAGGRRRFELHAAESASGHDSFRFEDVDDKSLKLLDGASPVMVYNHGMIAYDKAAGRKSDRDRSCYIHPLWGLNGEVLTDDFPPDHYYHHGVFWAWPHVGRDGSDYSLWTYKNIRQRFVRWLRRESGPMAAVLAVENGWFIGEEKVMVERVWMRTYKVSDDTRSIDMEFVWIPVDKPISLRGAARKSYGGMGIRFAVKDAGQSIVTTHMGKAGEDFLDTALPWADLTNKFGGGDQRSGAAIFVHPKHPDYPPTWLTRHYGPLCVGWPGVKGKTFEPGKPFSSSYRILIHKQPLDRDQLQCKYDSYAEATKASWQ